MKDQTKIAGVEWFYFCIENSARWTHLIGRKIEDQSFGDGIVSAVRQRENGNPIVSIDFGSIIDFTGDSFIEPEVHVWVPTADALVTKQPYRDAQAQIEQQEHADKAHAHAKQRLEEKNIKELLSGFSLWHMTHLSNISSILENGIFSHIRMHQNGMRYHDISKDSVQHWRERRETVYKRPIHSYVPLYINPRNAMLLARNSIQHQICLIEIDDSILIDKGCVVADGNAAVKLKTKFFKPVEGLNKLDWKLLRKGSWYNDNEVKHKEAKRKMCAEVLIPNEVPPDYFQSIRCYETKSLCYINSTKIPKIASPELYF